MPELLIFVAVLVALGAMLWKKIRRSQTKRDYRDQDGHSPEKAWVIHHRDQIEKKVKQTRCHCGGKPYKRSETPLYDSPGIQVVGCECMRCDEKIRLYFRMEYLN